MSVATATAAGRRAAEALMLDTFTAYSPTDDVETDEDGYEVPYYKPEGTTKGKVAGDSGRDTDARTVTIGGSERQVVEGGLHIPLAAPVPTVGEYGHGWEYVLTTLGPMTDPSLLNSRWLVLDSPAKSYATARRLNVVRLV